MELLEKLLNNKKYYVVMRLDNIYVGAFETKGEAIARAKKCERETQISCYIEEESLLALVEKEIAYAEENGFYKGKRENINAVEEKIAARYEEELAREKKKMQKELKKFLAKWVESDSE